MLDWLDSVLLARTAGWLVTYAVHSTVLLALAAMLAHRLAARRPAYAETLWRGALIGAPATASLAFLFARAPAPAEAMASPAAEASLAPMTTTAPAAAFPWTGALVALWAVVAAAFLASLCVSRWRLGRRLADRTPVDGPLASALDELRRDAGCGRRVRLTSSAALRVPATFGLWRAEICLPERAGDELSGRELAAVIGHELAHVVRRDPAWRLLARVLEGVFFFQPLNRLAARRLRRLSEYLCDDWTVTRTGGAGDLARCLAEVAGWTLERPRLYPVPGIAERRSELEHRVRRLLDRGVDRRTGPRRAAAFGVAAALLLTAWLAPVWTVAAAPETPPAEGEAEDEAPDGERTLRRLEEELERREEALRLHEQALRAQLEELQRHEQEIRRHAEEVEKRIRHQEEMIRERLRHHEERLRLREEEVELRARERAEELAQRARELEEHARQLSVEERERERRIGEHARELEERARRLMEAERDQEERLLQRARELEERARELAAEEREDEADDEEEP